MEPLINVRKLVKKFGDYSALKGIDLTCNEGDIYGFLGPNGAGKTTTIRCMLDFIRPTSGTVTIFGKDSREGSLEIRKQTGFLSADVALYQNWTGLQHIEYITGLRGSKALLSDLKEQFKIDFKKTVKQLSTGNRQKLGIILAVVGKPQLLILDEPTRGLDPIFQSEFYKLLLDLNKQGTTVFMSSHNLNEVEKVCNKITILKEGRIVSDGDIGSLRNMGMHLVTVYFRDNFSRDEFKHIANVEITGELHQGLMFKVKGDMNQLLQVLAKHNLKDLEASNSNLEEIFLDFYKK